ncbi:MULTISPECIES: aminomethyl-transferring glycine dehydrogenase subunit GcvPA [unclassified Azospirillum]|uniref:aminomethyl-transferring glycine dehydrogenase subunit GcvPA n=1 Tax=unclassified Azospirillum TaxID=2630922 RepID=UPI000B701886|nr:MULTISPECIES: aminomethyl-transferring glycine dehydrogenase subunit GcvPA [unclassified Azospirillum]SNR87813.1 glycine dehydrogenase (decarboxylating) alpha subunit [Azospirillum sp. RU38E]SNS03997.1 glycine dehydrogenase (decarboxylating) alpha subunit [Azospirillum sp. RU37A]
MRYLPLTETDRSAMLATIGVDSVDALFRDVPEQARLKGPIAGLSNHMGELAVERHLSRLAAKNVTASSVPFFIGGGAYKHHVPASVDQTLLRGEFLTSYTPYQPEVTQGTLQYLFEFQTQVALLTGMDVANASMYDGATGTAEAVLMAARINKRNKVILSGGLHPHYREVVETTCGVMGMDIRAQAPDWKNAEDLTALIDGETACIVVQTPSLFGHLRDFTALCDAAHAKGTLVIVVVTEVVSLGLLTPPGEMGADIVVCEGQSIGNGLNFGGPYVGLFATRDKYVRQMPGRLCGQTVDADGKRGFVLTLSTREQHIRREKATSNICTNSGLCALAFTIHLSLLGEQGLTKLARVNHANAVTLADKLEAVKGVKIVNDGFFNEFTVKLPKKAAKVLSKLAERGILAGVPVSRFYPEMDGLEDLLLVASTEVNSLEDMDALVRGLEEVL